MDDPINFSMISDHIDSGCPNCKGTGWHLENMPEMWPEEDSVCFETRVFQIEEIALFYGVALEPN